MLELCVQNQDQSDEGPKKMSLDVKSGLFFGSYNPDPYGFKTYGVRKNRVAMVVDET